MLSDRKETSEKTDAYADRDTNGEQITEHFIYRKEMNNREDHRISLHRISDHLVIKNINDA